MKKRMRLKLLLSLVLMFVGLGSGAPAEIIPPYGEGQIGLQAVVLCETLTVRQQPSASSKALKTLHYGDRIIVQPETGGWAACFLSDSVDGERAGWVNENYLAIDPAWYRTEENTAVYAWNDTIAPQVALLDKNTILPILRDDGEWLIVSLRGATGWIHNDTHLTNESIATGRQNGERFGISIIVEGMEESVRYEHAVNETMGIEIDYDYENFERRSETDCERFVSRYDSDPTNYLEIRRSAEDADTVAAAISEELSKTYDILREPYTLDRAGVCIRIDASRIKGANTMSDLLQMVYVIPTADGCVVAAAHYTIESAEGFGARIHSIINTLVVKNRQTK